MLSEVEAEDHLHSLAKILSQLTTGVLSHVELIGLKSILIINSLNHSDQKRYWTRIFSYSTIVKN